MASISVPPPRSVVSILLEKYFTPILFNARVADFTFFMTICRKSGRNCCFHRRHQISAPSTFSALLPLKTLLFSPLTLQATPGGAPVRSSATAYNRHNIPSLYCFSFLFLFRAYVLHIHTYLCGLDRKHTVCNSFFPQYQKTVAWSTDPLINGSPHVMVTDF